jgi:hypothetical protein
LIFCHDPFRARRVDHRERLVAEPPAARAVDFQVRDLDARAGDLPDADGFGNRLFQPGAFVPHVGRVNAAGVRGDTGELDDLRRLRVDAGHVLEPRRKADRAVGHALPDERLHSREL